jgi:hypothetical protein
LEREKARFFVESVRVFFLDSACPVVFVVAIWLLLVALVCSGLRLELARRFSKGSENCYAIFCLYPPLYIEGLNSLGVAASAGFQHGFERFPRQ